MRTDPIDEDPVTVDLTLLGEPTFRRAPITGDRTVELLACLTLAGPTGMSSDRLVDELWPRSSPANAVKALQVVVSRARRATDAALVERTSQGYRLGVGTVDAIEVERLSGDAATAWREGRVGDAVDAARGALAYEVAAVNGDGPLSHLRERAHRTRTQSRRLLALALASGGSPVDALRELEVAHDADPDDQEVLAALLLSEAAVRGAPAALERYERVRRSLVERLGVEPGEGLQRTYAQILASDRPTRQGVRFEADDLVGREGDVRALRTLLDRHRVVTILGPGGLGKTTIAHRVARAATEPIVHFVELVGVRDGGAGADDVAAEVGSALGVRETATSRTVVTPAERADLRARIVAHLDRAPTLLVLDNCEHVVEAVANLAAFLVASTRSLRILTTSRAPLAISAEHVYQLGHLDLDQAAHLFGLRAAATRPSIVLDALEVRTLVSRLDGLPLAIELAAAKARVMTVTEIADRLDRRFELLQGSDRAAPDRHRTLMAVIDWSWSLLSDRQQIALRRLAVFGGGFTLDAAEAIVGRTALDDVQGLVEQSLLSVNEGDRGIRFRMLETVREFGLLHLARAEEEEDVQHAVRLWAADAVKDVASVLFSERQAEVVDRLLAEETNLSDVLRGALVAGEAESAVGIGAALFHLWTLRGDIGRLLVTVPTIDVVLGDYRPAPHAEDTARLAAVVIVAVESYLGRPYTGHARKALQRLGPGTTPYVAAFVRVTTVLASGDEHAAREGLQELADGSDRLTRLLALEWCAQLEENLGLRDAARDHVRRALDEWRPEDGSWARATLELKLAQLFAQSGDSAAGARHAAHALPDLIRLGALDSIADARALMATDAIRRGDLVSAASMLPNDRATETGFVGGDASVPVRAELQIAQGQVAAGLAAYRQMADVMTQPIPGVGETLELFAAYGVSIAAAAHALHGEGDDLLDELARRLPAALANERRIDYPVLGAAVFGFGFAGLLRARIDPDVAATAFAIARRLNYVSYFPAYDWSNGEELIERIRPGALAVAERRLGQRRGPDLVAAARAMSFDLD